jgi:hypothetical protein
MNRADVLGNEFDPYLANNSAVEETTVIEAPPANLPPSVPELIFPTDGQTNVDRGLAFRWKKSNDPDGQLITYDLYYCGSAEVSHCSPVQIAQDISTTTAKGMTSAATLVLLGVVLAGSLRGRQRFVVIPMILLTSLLVISCGSNGGDDGRGGGVIPPPDEVSFKVATELQPNTRYFWKVVASDSRGGTSESEIRSFTTR